MIAAIAAQLAAVVSAEAAAPTVTAAATFVSLRSRVMSSWSSGRQVPRRRIDGPVTGMTAGEVATLYAQRFPYSHGGQAGQLEAVFTQKW